MEFVPYTLKWIELILRWGHVLFSILWVGNSFLFNYLDNKLNKDITSEDIDMILLPGGWGGTDVLSEDTYVQNLLKEMNNKNKDIGAMCAAPFALKSAGVLSDNYTCYPSVEEKIKQDGYNPNLKVVEDGNIITSQGPATAICFALYIVKKYVGVEMYEQLKGGLLVDFC